ncbi:MerR family transcriptional regulator [Iodidimonas muriae]|uniref:MerR family transcriptional regulator n=1 Tax=Iodidimonas muriae TaxID=261467 RepID=A0ABQ2LFT1_9PROT|nr:helix-turn-helix domain-containing protein [Iodidimonas muriae]GER08614.1 MerR family transcriptional regulator [Kordiimonadales bacterium JCM 17843]GGO15810.1 MerR family transcriptional regulator [Iodidimonas muriae]
MFTIGHVARATDCKVQTIRYYEQIGLLPQAPRSEGNRRLYAQADIDRLAFIRHARELGFPLDAIRELLSLSDDPNQSCAAADAIARRQLDQVERRITGLVSLKTELMRMIEQCRGGKISDCRVIEVLSDHAQCVTENHQMTEAKP